MRGLKSLKTLKTIDIRSWDAEFTQEQQETAVQALEEGKVVCFPKLPFALSRAEKKFLTPDIADPKSKNVSYDSRRDRLAGSVLEGTQADALKAMIKRYAESSKAFLERLIPQYKAHLIQARTSFRPVEIAGRPTSYRKDDTRLHVDAFPSSPTKGQRILRFFTNINSEGKPREWRVGEPFPDVVKRMMGELPAPIWGSAFFLKLLKITKDYRTAYDHYMLHLHDAMKRNQKYQKKAPQEEVNFPAGCTWIVYTDQVSHAAMGGQHVLEQTFHMPVSGLVNPTTSPLKVLERLLERTLV